MRHTAKPGLSGLAQVNGRNAIKWEDKLNWDLKYIENVTLLKDFSIILKTVKTAFIKQEGITDGDMAKIIGVSRTAYQQKIKSGRFSPEECKAFCTYFGKRFEYLFADDGSEYAS